MDSFRVEMNEIKTITFAVESVVQNQTVDGVLRFSRVKTSNIYASAPHLVPITVGAGMTLHFKTDGSPLDVSVTEK